MLTVISALTELWYQFVLYLYVVCIAMAMNYTVIHIATFVLQHIKGVVTFSGNHNLSIFRHAVKLQAGKTDSENLKQGKFLKIMLLKQFYTNKLEHVNFSIVKQSWQAYK